MQYTPQLCKKKKPSTLYIQTQRNSKTAKKFETDKNSSPKGSLRPMIHSQLFILVVDKI